MSGKLRLTGKTAVIARKALRKVCRILDKHGIPYVLEGGTLLGIIRENRLLPWDNDLDITITDGYLPELMKLKWVFRLAGYQLKERRIKEEVPYFPIGTVRLVKVKKTRLFRKNLGILDVFVKKRIDDRYYWVVGQGNPVLKSVPCHFYEKSIRYGFDGYDYSIPSDYDDYLTCRYGDWRITVKDYDYKKDDKSIVKT